MVDLKHQKEHFDIVINGKEQLAFTGEQHKTMQHS